MAQTPVPAGGEYLWSAFVRLHGRRGSTGFGPAALSWPDIEAFNRLSRMNLAPWEVEVIEELDRVYLIHTADAARERAGNSSKT